MTALISTTERSTLICRAARWWAMIFLIGASFVQVLIEPSLENIACTFIVLTTTIVTVVLTIRSSVIRSVPLPVLVVLAFNFATLSGALLVQSASFRPLVFNLKVSFITFGSCALFQLALLIGLQIFRSIRTLQALSSALNHRILVPLNLMRRPTSGQLWTLGFIGFGILAWSSLVQQTNITKIEYGDVSGKALLGMTYLLYAPYLMPLLRFIYPQSKPAGKQVWFLVAYTIGIAVLGIAQNSRATILIGIANLTLAGTFLIFLGQVEITKKFRRVVMVIALGSVFAMPPIADLAIAMVLVRGERSETDALDLVSKTWNAFWDKAAIDEFRQAVFAAKSQLEYEETYLANPIFARFIQTKFVDNTLSYTDVRNGLRSAELWDVTLDKLFALLPTPVLRLLDAKVDKAELDFSMGDALYSFQNGGTLGGYKTGSPLGHGFGLIGGWIFLAIIPFLLLLFIALQSLTHTASGYVVISPIALLQLMSIYYLLCGDSLVDATGYLLRTLPQNILIYAITFKLTAILLLVTRSILRR